ncbi:hypothetical protein PUN28_002710 [Cardiocondyla obscurior]|uniref:Uncharacterized protein n=1 Tax=Cardiocondyla obscurior TaxID=286306 RepID=A0AAW2GVZ0_9HYME
MNNANSRGEYTKIISVKSRTNQRERKLYSRERRRRRWRHTFARTCGRRCIAQLSETLRNRYLKTEEMILKLKFGNRNFFFIFFFIDLLAFEYGRWMDLSHGRRKARRFLTLFS